MKTLLTMSIGLNVLLMAAFFFNLNRLYLLQEKLADALHRLNLLDRSPKSASVAKQVSTPQRAMASTCNRNLQNARFNERLELRKTPEPSWIND